METVGKPKQPTPRPERNSLLQTLANSPRNNPKSRIETMDQLFGNITKTLFNTPDGPQVETKKILGKGRGSKLSTPRKAAAERKGKDRRDLASDGRKLINHPGQMVHSGMSKSVNMGNVFHMVENQRNDEALTISMEVHQPLQFSDGTVAQSVDAAIAKSMDIGDVLNLLEGEAVVGDLTVPQAVDIREASLSGSLPIVIDDSGTLNVVLGAEDLQQSSSLELEAVVQPQEAVLESDEGMQAASESYLMEYASQEGETPQNEAGLSAEQPSDDNNIMIVDEDGQPIMNDEMQAQSGNIVVTTSGHIIIQGQVFKLDMKEGTTLDLEKISIRQDEDGQIFLETIEPDTGAEEENAETNEP